MVGDGKKKSSDLLAVLKMSQALDFHPRFETLFHLNKKVGCEQNRSRFVDVCALLRKRLCEMLTFPAQTPRTTAESYSFISVDTTEGTEHPETI